jgi:F-type H+-transporting ATPase subunit b
MALGAPLWFPLQALAANTGGSWRSTYDVVMMWVNFAILVALLVKFLRKPLGRLLKSQQDAIQNTLDQLETQKGRLRNEIQSLRETLEARKQKAEDRHARIIRWAQRERLEIIATARQEAERRLRQARRLIDARHREACQALRNDIVDAAVTKVLQDLPGHMTAELEKDLTERFLTSITKPGD